MKRLKFILFLAAIAAMGSSCASIVSRSSYPVYFESNPEGARVTIENRDGFIVYDGATPVTVYLDAAAGYMRREIYRVTYSRIGREPVTTYIDAQINGWYFGNLLLGGWIGMLIVDPLTGAMYRIPEHAPRIDVYGPDEPLPPYDPSGQAQAQAAGTENGSAAGSSGTSGSSTYRSSGTARSEPGVPRRAVIRRESAATGSGAAGSGATEATAAGSTAATNSGTNTPPAPSNGEWTPLGE